MKSLFSIFNKIFREKYTLEPPLSQARQRECVSLSVNDSSFLSDVNEGSDTLVEVALSVCG